jgi:hypothetical protein
MGRWLFFLRRKDLEGCHQDMRVIFKPPLHELM